jgi:1,4-alpha-glucan branching enzyme
VFWLDKYHIDALRVDGVASMLYLDYSREHGEWIPNQYGGRENIDAISFLRQFNETVYQDYPSAQTIAEESTAWPGVSRPTYLGGLGFGMKWDMGWMHDTLEFFKKEPVHRKFHQDQLTFRAIYAFHENFVLSLSHDEVVHGKGSLLDRMPGDGWQKFANLRLLYTYMYALPGKKLLFMGQEFGQGNEWNHDDSLHWSVLQADPHRTLQTMVRDLNQLYRNQPCLHELDTEGAGFEWVDTNDRDNSVLVFMRKAKNPQDRMVCVLNLTPVPRENYRIGVDLEGYWREVFNSDRIEYGGSGVGNPNPVEASPVPAHGRAFSLNLHLPPLAAILVGPCESPS